jgi:succinate dehydrogenase/fumarate reductase flavoprotein subunit
MNDVEVDVVVVGGGGSGLMAAYAAARHGRSVLLLEKASALGGTTGLSVGTICASATDLQRRAGIDDDPDSHFTDMDLFVGPLANRDNLELRRLLVDNVSETVGILSDLGVEFMGPLPEPPHSKPRLHAIIPHSRGYIRHLENACRKRSVSIWTDSHVDQLVYRSGRVAGVRANGKSITARRGVILASGDFSSAEPEYKARFMQGPLLDIGGINPNSTGDGQKASGLLSSMATWPGVPRSDFRLHGIRARSRACPSAAGLRARSFSRSRCCRRSCCGPSCWAS